MSSSVQPPRSNKLDPNITFRLCANYFIHLFASRQYPFPARCSYWQARFPDFVASLLHQSNLDISVAIGALTLLHRFKAVYKTTVAYYNEASRLFLEAYMAAATAMGCTRPMSFWKRVSGDRYSLEQLFHMEAQFQKDLLGYVDIDPNTFDWFKTHLEGYFDAMEFVNGTVDSVLRSDAPPVAVDDVPVIAT